MSASTACTSGSSSTISTRAVREGGATVMPVTESGSAMGIGSRTTNVLPAPGALSTSIVPPWRVTMPHDTARPSPVPRGPLEVKNGSNTRRRISSGMPTPVSFTEMVAQSGRASRRTVQRPPSGIASTALVIRLVRTSRSSSGRPATGGASPSTVNS